MAVPPGAATYTTINPSGMIASGHAVPLGQKRPGGPPGNKMIATRAVIPTARYTVNPVPSSSSFIPSSTVVVNSSQSPSPAGMPQLQSHSGPGSSSSAVSQQQQRILAASSSASVTRVMASQPVIQAGGKGNGGPTKRVITPTSGAMNHPTSGALTLDHQNN
uniref:Mixed-lineage leukemia-like protein n=1 Tax=Caenorhabditis tropicalis TaxID=1561998 RepID=A0A1I7V342_9PELO